MENAPFLSCLKTFHNIFQTLIPRLLYYINKLTCLKVDFVSLPYIYMYLTFIDILFRKQCIM